MLRFYPILFSHLDVENILTKHKNKIELLFNFLLTKSLEEIDTN